MHLVQNEAIVFRMSLHYESESGVQNKGNRPRKNVQGDFRNRLTEEDAGITEYVSKHEGFSAVIKQRFSDFHVNEIDTEGNVITLTCLTAPHVEVKVDGLKADHEETLKSVLSSEDFERIKLLVEKEDSDLCVEIEVTEKNKEERKVLHCALKAVGAGKLVSNTKEKEGKKFICITRHTTKLKDKQDRRVAWPANLGGDYVHFVLHKENMDTMESVNLIASKLRIKTNMITYAGIKDRRAKTTQLMSVRRIEPSKLAQVSSKIRCITLGNYSFKPKGLKLGDLQGNRFRIVLRNVTGSDEQINEAMTSLSEKGFLNYYGLQRFGSSCTVPTYEIGKALLRGNWKLAVELILKPRGDEPTDLAEARKIWWETRNASKALKILRNKEKLIEGKLLLALSLCKPNDYFTALEKIPRNTRLLYLHSYQSVLWNKVVSKRIKVFGLQPLPGDLVFLNAGDENIANADVSDRDDTGTQDTMNDRKNVVKVLLENEVEGVNVQDIVMPLPGHDIIYPENVTRDWYEDLLKMDGLSSVSLKQSVRKYSVGGAYRKMVVHPNKINWKTVQYNDPDKTLELSDLEKLNGTPAPDDDPGGSYKALILDFCLPSSTYATMALREILKADTSSQHQASLNNYHVKENMSDIDETKLKDQVMSVSNENKTLYQELSSQISTADKSLGAKYNEDTGPGVSLSDNSETNDIETSKEMQETDFQSIKQLQQMETREVPCDLKRKVQEEEELSSKKIKHANSSLVM